MLEVKYNGNQNIAGTSNSYLFQIYHLGFVWYVDILDEKSCFYYGQKQAECLKIRHRGQDCLIQNCRKDSGGNGFCCVDRAFEMTYTELSDCSAETCEACRRGRAYYAGRTFMLNARRIV